LRPGPDFDLVVIDEAPWFSLLRGVDDPETMPVSALQQEWWQDRLHPADEETDNPRVNELDAAMALLTLDRVRQVLAAGKTSAEAFIRAQVSARAVRETRSCLFNCMVDLRPLVRPGTTLKEIERATTRAGPINRRVGAAARFLDIITLLLDGDTGPAALELTADGLEVRLRWRENIDESWTASRLAYLDAAGTASNPVKRQADLAGNFG
jgi:hypothetical protein